MNAVAGQPWCLTIFTPNETPQVAAGALGRNYLNARSELRLDCILFCEKKWDGGSTPLTMAANRTVRGNSSLEKLLTALTQSHTLPVWVESNWTVFVRVHV